MNSSELSSVSTTPDIHKEPTTYEEAILIINDIREQQCQLCEETTNSIDARLPPKQKAEIERVLARSRRGLAKFIESTTKLNSSNAHFILELLQNADDADYDTASKAHDKPRIRFQIARDTITIDTNEDGFTEANVRAICETGESSKKSQASRQRIGEKGIGFKSIFRVAESVHIASGVWRFHFDYPEGDDGLGMVTPKVDQFDVLPEKVGTRITMKLNRQHRNKIHSIIKDFEELPDTITYFLWNIMELEVVQAHEDAKGTWENFTITKSELDSRGIRVITRSMTESSGEVKHRRNYYREYSSQIINMPPDENRKNNETAVKLAFPVHESGSVAVIEPAGQHVFSFLPLYRKVQLKFLIQSDFITTPNREDIAPCDWNHRLLQATADTFCAAIRNFCQRGILKSEWPNFIPMLPIETYWAPLQSLIIVGLRQQLVCRTMSSGTLRLPREVCQIPLDFKYEDKPLLKDRTGQSEVYITPELQDHHAEVLDLLHVPMLHWNHVMDRLADDLIRSDSTFTSRDTSSRWHDAMATLLLTLYPSSNSTGLVGRLEHMRIIPLTTGRWRSALESSGSHPPNFHFPTIGKVRVPDNLGYDLVDPNACLSRKRTQLFLQMGAKTLNFDQVERAIFKLHKTQNKIRIPDAVDALYFLYRFKTDMREIKQDLQVCTSLETFKNANSEIYLQSDDDYSVQWLLEHKASLRLHDMQEVQKWLLHPAYFDERLIDRPNDKLTWRKWLMQDVGIPEIPTLITMGPKSQPALSLFFQELLLSSSQTFLTTLKVHWTHYRQSDLGRRAVLHHILANCEVACQNNINMLLSETYMPAPEVLAKASELHMLDRSPVLCLDLGDEAFSSSAWAFLKDVGVRETVDPDFYLQALRSMSTQDTANISDMAVIAYDYIGAHAGNNIAEYLQTTFEDEALVYCRIDSEWRPISDCVWHGSSSLTVKQPLAVHYEGNPNIRHLFQNLLKVADASWQDFVQQLVYIKSCETQETPETLLGKLSTIYLELFNCQGVNWDEVRSILNKEKLIYRSGKWYRLSSCLWSSSVNIKGCIILNQFYAHLEALFIQRLQVKKASIVDIVSELIKRTNSRAGLSTAEAKDLMKKISGMLKHEQSDSSLETTFDELVQHKFLPVRRYHEEPYLVDCSSNFTIRDHCVYSQAFAETALFLDFSFAEFPQVVDLLEALSLDANYISELVEERPSLGDDYMLSLKLTKDLIRRAPCLFSCAYKYHGSRIIDGDTSMLDELHTMQVYTCSTISTELVLDLHDVQHRITTKEAQVLVERRNSNVCIFVPKDEKKQRSCFRYRLPRELQNLMSIKSDLALSPISQMLMSAFSDIEDVMVEANIPLVPWLRPDVYKFISDDMEEVEVEDQIGDSQMHNPVTPVSNSNRENTTSSVSMRNSPPSSLSRDSATDQTFANAVPQAPSLFSSYVPHTSLEGTSFSQSRQSGLGQTSKLATTSNDVVEAHLGDRHAVVRDHQNSSATGLSSISAVTSLPPTVRADNKYRDLLDQVIKCGKHGTESLPPNSAAVSKAFDFSVFGLSLPSLLDTEATFGAPGLVRDFKIGAAGELYVFELLKTLQLPDFGLINWQSTIRKYVNAHPDYESLEDWGGRETSDIVYCDKSGQLKEWLRTVSCNGFPDFPSSGSFASNFECTYYIEVKTTVNQYRNTPFYMSNNEYNMMNKLKTNAAADPKKIYVIVRVFDVTKDIKFNVFVDPCRSRDDSVFCPSKRPALRFEAAKWKVHPSHT